MAPTISDDRNDGLGLRRSRNRIVKQRSSSVINFVASRNRESSSSEDSVTSPSSSTTDSLIHSHKHIRSRRDSDELSVDSCSQNSLFFHNYSKRYEDAEDDKDNETQRCPSRFSDDDSISSTPSTPSTSTSSLYDDLTYLKRRPNSPHMLCSFPSPSSVSSTSDAVYPLQIALIRHRPRLPTHFATAQRRGLIEIAMKTIKLLQKNRTLQARLEQLQVETRQFVDSVMSNPENAEIRKEILSNDEQEKINVTKAITFAIGQ